MNIRTMHCWFDYFSQLKICSTPRVPRPLVKRSCFSFACSFGQKWTQWQEWSPRALAGSAMKAVCVSPGGTRWAGLQGQTRESYCKSEVSPALQSSPGWLTWCQIAVFSWVSEPRVVSRPCLRELEENKWDKMCKNPGKEPDNILRYPPSLLPPPPLDLIPDILLDLFVQP